MGGVAEVEVATCRSCSKSHVISARAFTVAPACSAGIRRLISPSRELIRFNSLTSSGELALAGTTEVLTADLVAGVAGTLAGLTAGLDGMGEGLAGTVAVLREATSSSLPDAISLVLSPVVVAGGGVAADCCCWVCVCSLAGTNGFREGEP